jgi:hypothetical protein
LRLDLVRDFVYREQLLFPTAHIAQLDLARGDFIRADDHDEGNLIGVRIFEPVADPLG